MIDDNRNTSHNIETIELTAAEIGHLFVSIKQLITLFQKGLLTRI